MSEKKSINKKNVKFILFQNTDANERIPELRFVSGKTRIVLVFDDKSEEVIFTDSEFDEEDFEKRKF